MSLAQPGDGVRARDGLSRRADTLLEVITAAVADATAGVAGAAADLDDGCDGWQGGDRAGGELESDLPHDPFGGSLGSSPGGGREGLKGLGQSHKGAGVDGLLHAVHAARRVCSWQEARGWCVSQQRRDSNGCARCDEEAAEALVGRDRQVVVERGELREGGHERLLGLQQALAESVPRVAAVGAAAAGFVRMCDEAQACVHEEVRARAEAVEQGAVQTMSLLCSSWSS
jgi:hypothetical protein